MFRIFELDGEFRCVFLDDKQRYFQVVLNLATTPPEPESTIIPTNNVESPHDEKRR